MFSTIAYFEFPINDFMDGSAREPLNKVPKIHCLWKTRRMSLEVDGAGCWTRTKEMVPCGRKELPVLVAFPLAYFGPKQNVFFFLILQLFAT